eukprot:TRINITY_DN5126_c0_g1_i1.p1 TRINITY_DN5126_c0_g1~~TRINITY_DN5126_c0_g1_i1.p1  ORF type:complete len:255 (-),score=16.60 TRINITY_DN5126_c0_g1_i1:546-1196(-)
MANLRYSSISCEVTVSCGQHISVIVKRSWTVSDLREHLRCANGIPEYEQHFAQGSKRLRSDDILCNLDRGHETNRLALTLVKESIPKRFSPSRTNRIWEAFVAFSSDYGDSINGMKATHVAQFANMYQVAQVLASSTNLPQTLNFCELLDLFASLAPSSKVKTDATPIQDDVCDPCLHFKHGDVGFERWSADSSTEDDENFSEFDSDLCDEPDAST